MRFRNPPRERAWLEEVFQLHSRQLRAFAVRRVGPDSADDIVSEVFAVAWRRRDEIPDPALAWLYQTARHAVLHHYRTLSNQSRLRQALNANSHGGGVLSAEDQSRSLVDSVLDGLDDVDAEVLRLTVWEELAPAEIAFVLGISPGAARNRLLRARKRAQRLYEASVQEQTQSVTVPCTTLS